ncbi:hypothetical protein [Methylobacterium sp. J-090]|uniref:hypothetical protein n=1 Tax=Methylobacterium sp. J-090 TaxID=2836666 RepID=UPI001FBB0557|nr:hypothetical protein [Methylobacterium sp. J-090]MCJ2079856.1 hypothetical protein [Methylobacterium sp. J-090]
MTNVHTFIPRRPVPTIKPRLSFGDTETRQRIEEAAQSALDTADRLIALLDRMDGDDEHEDGGDAEPSLAAPENHHASQITWLLGSSSDREQDSAR